jgi:hypothetical protein
MLAWDKPEVSHEISRRRESTKVSDLGNQSNSNHRRDTA